MKSSRKWRITILIALLALAGYFAALPAYCLAKTLRARYLIQDLYYDEYDTSNF